MAEGDLREIKQFLQDRIESVCRALLPDGRREGRLWVSNNPITNDHRHTPALKVALDRDCGAWIDYRSGDKGDVLQLVAYCNRLHRSDVKGALEWSRDFLGIRRMSQADRNKMRKRANEQAKLQQKRADDLRLRKLRRVPEIFERALPLSDAGALQDHALAYFKARGISLDKIQNVDFTSFRAKPDVEWWRGAEWRIDDQGRRQKMKNGPRFPAILSAMRAPSGAITAVHHTFLDPLRPAKAPVDVPKLMFGEAKGSMIWLTSGPEGRSPLLAQESHPLALFEGVETGLFAAQSIEARCWAVGSLSNFANAPINQAFVEWVFLGRDNNDGNPRAQKQLQAALDTLDTMGKPIIVANSHVGDDFNDLH